MKSTRCKFICQSVTKSRHWNREKGFIYEAKFSCVADGSEENKSFFAATPSGSLSIGTYTDDVFEVGKDYYLDLTPAPE